VTKTLPWQQRIGRQRDWVWRGWQTRYTYLRAQSVESATPLLLVHGFGASIGHWRHNLTDLSQQRTVYAIDLLGFGASQKAAETYHTALWVAQVYDFWQTFIRQPVILVGNSLGSSVGLAIAAAHPDMVAGLIMINLPDFSLLQSPAWLQPVTRVLGVGLRPVIALAETLLTAPPIFLPLFRLIRQPHLVRGWAKQAYASAHAVTDELVDILASPAYDQDAGNTLRHMVKTLVHTKPIGRYTARTVLPKLQLPMLLIWGQQDNCVPPKLAPLCVKLNPQIRLVAIDNAGHCPHDECPERVNRLILEWLAEWSAHDLSLGSPKPDENVAAPQPLPETA
jgi:pimeloyl-ACP methyl ester carboxylesterase